MLTINYERGDSRKVHVIDPSEVIYLSLTTSLDYETYEPDPNSRDLTIGFRGGSELDLPNLPPQRAADLMATIQGLLNRPIHGEV